MRDINDETALGEKCRQEKGKEMPKESWKKQTWWSLPVYTGDVSGVCSALYELGGMVVMHDPSGCNSTYNTHDEIRWTKMESLIFLSGLTQLDAITGNDRKLIDDIVLSARQFHPAFIAIANSPVPWLIGTDFTAVCRKVTEETGIPAFYIETNAMHDYTRGAGQAFLELARLLFSEEKENKIEKRSRQDEADIKFSSRQDETDIEISSRQDETDIEISSRQDEADIEISSRQDETNTEINRKQHIEEGETGRIRVNVLGVTPLDFTVMSQVDTLRKMLLEEGFDIVSVWGMGDSLENLARAHMADVNLVLSSVGIDTARWMEENLKIPYVAGVPSGRFAEHVFKALKQTAGTGVSCVPYLEVLEKARHGNNPAEQIAGKCYAGEPVTMGSLAADQILCDGRPADLIPLTETFKGLVLEGTVMPRGEQQIVDLLGSYPEAAGDPMLKSACREDCHFTEIPHLALSGRLYLNQIRPLIY